MSREKKQLYAKLIEMLKRPDEWVSSHFTYTHKSGVSIWISSGWTFCGVYQPQEVYFGLMRAWFLWRAVKNCAALSALQKLEAPNASK